MRIVAVRDIVSPIRSNIANAYIDFSQMTASVVAVVTDLKVEAGRWSATASTPTAVMPSTGS